jgi:hypothetical protein
MKQISLMAVLISQSILSVAQNLNNEHELASLVKLDVGLQGVGFGFEPKLNKKTTMDISVGAGGGYDVWEGGVGYEWNILQPAFYFALTPKYYYNRKKRNNLGKTSRLNSGNYIGFRVKFTTPSVAPNDALRKALLLNFHWGIQRAIANRWILNGHIGAGYAQDLGSQFGTIYPAIDFKLSYYLSKLKAGQQ